MRRSTFVLAAALAVGIAGTAAAQPPAGGPPPGGMGGGPGGPGGPGGGMMQRMLFDGITLTPAQQTVVDSIQTTRRAAMRARMEAARAGGPPDEAARATMMQEMRTAQEQDRAAMRALLTADQRKTFDANVARMQERMRQRMQQGGAPGGGPGRGGRD